MTREVQDKFMTWFLDKYLKYGDWFEEWWKAEGGDLFFKYAKKRGQEYMDLRGDK